MKLQVKEELQRFRIQLFCRENFQWSIKTSLVTLLYSKVFSFFLKVLLELIHFWLPIKSLQFLATAFSSSCTETIWHSPPKGFNTYETLHVNCGTFWTLYFGSVPKQTFVLCMISVEIRLSKKPASNKLLQKTISRRNLWILNIERLNQ